MVSLHNCTWGFSRCREQVLLSRCNARASHSGGFFHCRVDPRFTGFYSCSVWVQQLWCQGLAAWPGIEPMSPELQGGFLTIWPPGKPRHIFIIWPKAWLWLVVAQKKSPDGCVYLAHYSQDKEGPFSQAGRGHWQNDLKPVPSPRPSTTIKSIFRKQSFHLGKERRMESLLWWVVGG